MAALMQKSLMQCGCGCGCELQLILDHEGGKAVGCGWTSGDGVKSFHTELKTTLTCDFLLLSGHPDYELGGDNERTCTTERQFSVVTPVWVGPLGGEPDTCDTEETSCSPLDGCSNLGRCDEDDPGYYLLQSCAPVDYETQGAEQTEESLCSEASGEDQWSEKITLLGANESYLQPSGENEYRILIAPLQSINYAYNWGDSPWSLIRPIAGVDQIKWRIKWSDQGCGPAFTLKYTKRVTDQKTGIDDDEEITENDFADAMGTHDLAAEVGTVAQVRDIYITFEVPLL